jgi:ketosteroid isomerase-like protein
MTESDVEVVRRHYHAFNRGDLEALVEGLDPEVEFTGGDARAALELGGPHRGRDAVRRYFAQLFETFAQNQVEVVKVEDDGDRLIASVYLHGPFRDTGIGGALPAVHVFTVRHGLILANCMYREGDIADP